MLMEASLSCVRHRRVPWPSSPTEKLAKDLPEMFVASFFAIQGEVPLKNLVVAVYSALDENLRAY